MTGTRLKIFSIVILLAGIALFNSCENAPLVPKPRGYFRIALPEKEYLLYDPSCPYSFEISVSAQIKNDQYTLTEPCWINIEYPAYAAKIHLSYKNLETNSLYDFTEDAHEMVFKHAQKASGIRESFINLPDQRVFGKAWTIDGSDVASPFQFYVTDSLNHYIRGALYFNLSPNNDSLKPVIEFIIEDIDHLIQTLNWKPKA
jgi:gliding motility-associated lipoprotein GldD